MYYEICISFYRKSFKSAKSRHSEDFELVRQVFIIQKIIPGDMISYRKKVLVNFFSEQTLIQFTLVRKITNVTIVERHFLEHRAWRYTLDQFTMVEKITNVTFVERHHLQQGT